MLEAIVPSDQTVVYTHRYETQAGEAAAGILSIAKAENVKLIVMGTHGRSGPIKFSVLDVGSDEAAGG